MGKASEKGWDLDMAYIHSVFAYLTVWLNPIRIKAKFGKYVNICMVSWILFMWDQIMPKALNEFIKKEEVRAKLEWQVKDNTALNFVHNFLKDGHLHAELRTLIRLITIFTDLFPQALLTQYTLTPRKCTSSNVLYCSLTTGKRKQRVDGYLHL